MIRLGQVFNIGNLEYTVISIFSDNDKVFCVAKTVMGDYSNYRIFWYMGDGKFILCS